MPAERRPEGLGSSGAPSDEYRGFWDALTSAHIPFDPVPPAHLAAMAASGVLDRFRVLIAPDLGTLADDGAAALDAWVERGGRLFSTGDTGIAGTAPQLASLGVAAVTAHLDTPESTWSSVVLPEGGGAPFPVLGALHVVTAREGSTVEGRVLSRAPFGPPEKCYGHLPLEHPPLIRHHYGAGETVTAPWTPGHAFFHLGLSTVADHVTAVVRGLLGDPDVVTTLPPQIEVTAGRSDAGTVLHLRNLSGLHHQGYRDPVRIPAGSLLGGTWAESASQARSLVSGRELDRRDGAYVLPEIDAFEVIVLS